MEKYYYKFGDSCNRHFIRTSKPIFEINQETFECVECGHTDNADFNASVNIRNRVTVTVLRDSLLKRFDNGAYEPRKLKREKVKDVLLSFRRSLMNKSDGECSEIINLNTFDYV